MKNKIILVCTLLISVMLMLVGCGSSAPSAKTIVEDLKFNSEATRWQDYVFDIVDCEIITYSPNGKNFNTYECEVTKRNSEYEIVANCTIDYSKTENGWTMSDYKENTIDVTPLSEVKDDIVISYIQRKYGDNDNTTVTNITHNFDKNSKTDNITAEYSCAQRFYNKSGSININAVFNNGWDLSNSYDNTQGAWNLQAAVGTWQSTESGDNYTVEFKVLSIDENAKTATFQFRYARHGFVAGGRNGWDLIESEPYSEPEIFNLRYYEDRKEPSIVLGYGDFYDMLFDESYCLSITHDAILIDDNKAQEIK